MKDILVVNRITKKGIDLNTCSYCGCSIDDFSRTIDHLVPKSRGGILSNDNKVPSCGDCNKMKGDMDVVEFERALDSMIFYEVNKHKKDIGHLKKVRWNVKRIIGEIYGDSTEHSSRSGAGGGGSDTELQKERP